MLDLASRPHLRLQYKLPQDRDHVTWLFDAAQNKTRKCESGGIGRRTRLRIWRGNPWGFESPLSHQ